MKTLYQRFWAAGIGVAIFFHAGIAVADTAQCGAHGGVAGCDPTSGRVLCKDGMLDMRYSCSVPKTHSNRKVKRVLKFKQPPDRGQILLPGQKPPSSTLEESQKVLLPGATQAASSAR